MGNARVRRHSPPGPRASPVFFVVIPNSAEDHDLFGKPDEGVYVEAADRLRARWLAVAPAGDQVRHGAHGHLDHAVLRLEETEVRSRDRPYLDPFPGLVRDIEAAFL